MDKKLFARILSSEMQLATGCTEPAAVALAAAEAARALAQVGGKVECLEVSASTNILKNAMAAGIPGTSYTGMDYAAAIGAVGGDPDRLLEVINDVPKEKLTEAEALVKEGKVSVSKAETSKKLYIDVIAKGNGHTGRAVIQDLHTNIVQIQQDNEIVKEQRGDVEENGSADNAITPEQIAEALSIQMIWEYCINELDPINDPIDIIRSAVSVNSAISDAGMKQEYGLAIGRMLEECCREGTMTMDMTTNAMMVTAAAADARMAGAPQSVVTNSGSGNQGITATMPVVAVARWLKIPEEKMFRAVTMSNLIVIYIKSKFGRLSNLCGATVAATGVACAITYLLGGGYEEVCNAVHNVVGNVAGMVCDGAKADCALKISSCVNAAVQAACMAKRGIRVQSTDGVVEQDVERTINNFAILSNQGTDDQVILHLMLNKQNNHN